MTMYTVGMKLGTRAQPLTIEAEDALVAAVKSKLENPEAVITYVRKAHPRFDPLSVHRFIGTDAFDDLEADAMFRCQIAPGGARCLDRVDRIDDDGMPKTEMFVRQRHRNLIGRGAGFGFCQSRAPHRRLDRVDREN